MGSNLGAFYDLFICNGGCHCFRVDPKYPSSIQWMQFNIFAAPKKLNTICLCFSGQVWDVCLLFFSPIYLFFFFWHDQQEVRLYRNSSLASSSFHCLASLCGIGSGVRIVYILFAIVLVGKTEGKLCWWWSLEMEIGLGSCLVDLLLILHKYARFWRRGFERGLVRWMLLSVAVSVADSQHGGLLSYTSTYMNNCVQWSFWN